MSDLLAGAMAFGFVTLGVVLAWIAKRLFTLESGSLFASVVLVPVAAFLIISGRVSEFAGYGLSAKFREAAASQDKPLHSEIKNIIASGRAGIAQALLGPGAEVAFLQAPAQPQSQAAVPSIIEGLASEIYPSLLRGTFQALVVTDKGGRVLGFFEPHFFSDLLRIEVIQTMRGSRQRYDAERVRAQLEQTLLWDIVEQPDRRAKEWGVIATVKETDSNAAALRKMAESNASVLVVVDAKGTYKGIVRRQDIISTLLLALPGVAGP